MRRLLSLAAALVMLAHGGAAARMQAVTYLHVGASEGSSLGGHAALEVGDVVFHFQHRSPGVLVLDRTDPETFYWNYGTVQNRTIRRVRLLVADVVADQLRTALGTSYLVQRQHLGIRDALARDRALFAEVADGDDDPDAAVAVRGAAPFFQDGERIESSRATDDMLEAFRSDIASIDPTWAPALPPRLVSGVPVDTKPSVADRRDEQLESVVASNVLAYGRHVRPGRLVHLDDTPPLSSRERAALQGFARHLREATVRLPRVGRPGWGLAVLVSLARLDAVDASLASGHLVLVDAPAIPGDRIAAEDAPDSARIREGERFARQVLRDVRAATLQTGMLDEASWARLEGAGMRVAAISGWDRPDATPRATPIDATPTASALLRGLPHPSLPPDHAKRALARTEDAIDAWDDEIRAAYPYDLFRGNCVTALVEALEDAGVPGVTMRALGFASFIPRVSFDRVATTPSASGVDVRPSYRRRELDAMRTREAPLLVRLREDNVLTSTLPRAIDDQPAFLFFTDDTMLPRPVYGAANLAVAAAQSGAGFLAAPFDHARLLLLGLRGVVASVPELAFVSVRTGRFRYDRDAMTALAD